MKSEFGFVLAGLIGLGCSSAPADELVGVARASIVMAPPSARCLTVKVAGSSTVTKNLTVTPEENAIFDLTSLPVGSDTFTAQAFAVSCSALSGATPTYVSSPITATVGVSPVNITFEMVPASSSSGNANIGFDFNDHGVITEFPLPSGLVNPTAITPGSDGNLWLTVNGGLARITPTGSYSAFPVLASAIQVENIAAGPDHNLWFTEITRNKVGRLTPEGTLTEFTPPTGNAVLLGITAGPDGNLWFAEDTHIGRITVTGVITEFPVTGYPFDVTAGPDGNIWFTEPNSAQIGRMTPTGAVALFTIPTASPRADMLASGPDGNLWFCEMDGNKIGRITPTGTITEFVVPTPSSSPFDITVGPDGNLWFTEAGTGKIGRITPTGAITEFATPTSDFPWGITAGPDGNVWFVENSPVPQVGRITP